MQSSRTCIAPTWTCFPTRWPAGSRPRACVRGGRERGWGAEQSAAIGWRAAGLTASRRTPAAVAGGGTACALPGPAPTLWRSLCMAAGAAQARDRAAPRRNFCALRRMHCVRWRARASPLPQVGLLHRSRRQWLQRSSLCLLQVAGQPRAGASADGSGQRRGRADHSVLGPPLPSCTCLMGGCVCGQPIGTALGGWGEPHKVGFREPAFAAARGAPWRGRRSQRIPEVNQQVLSRSPSRTAPSNRVICGKSLAAAAGRAPGAPQGARA